MFKRLFLCITLMLSFYVFVDYANAETITNSLTRKPSSVSFWDGRDYGWSGAATSVSAWGFSGWLSHDYNSGSTMPIPYQFGWKYDSFPEMAGKNWSINFQIFTTSTPLLFGLLEYRVFVVTDYGNVGCSTVRIGNGEGISVFCAGQSTTSLRIILEFTTYKSNLSTGVMLRSDWSELKTDLDIGDLVNIQNQIQQNIIDANRGNTTSIMNALGQTSQNVIDNQNKNTQDIINSNKEINNTLTDDNIDSSVSQSNSFFDNFSTDTYGLTAIVTSPLQLIGSITSSTCSDVSADLPYNLGQLTLPCMSETYKKMGGELFTLYQTITDGLISYWVIVRIFALVKDFKNPDHDEIEVLEL